VSNVKNEKNMQLVFQLLREETSRNAWLILS